MPELELVRATVGDLEVLSEFHLALNREMARYARSYPEEILVPHNVTYLLQRHLEREEFLAWLALANGEPVGFVSITLHGSPVPGSDRLTGTIANLYVVPSVRRQGVGRALAQHAIAALRAVGAQHIELQFLIQNQAAARFWASVGFVAERITAILPPQ